MHDPVDDLVHDHGDINRLVLNVASILRDADHESLDNALLQLEERLFRHFAREEEGLFPLVREMAPQFEADLDGMLAAHDMLCGILARATAALETAASPWPMIGGMFERFETVYAEHAKTEAELLRRLSSSLTDEQRARLSTILEGV